MSDWDPDLYNRFARYRAEPVEMILARLQIGGAERIVDLGCGSGEHTVELARRSQNGSALGIDSSPAMIDRASRLRETLDEDLKRRVNFTLGDIRDFSADREYTIIFSNAAFQWMSDHRSVLAACYRALWPGGTLANQMPSNENERAQATMMEMAAEAPWRATLGALQTPSKETVLTPEEYRTILAGIGFTDLDCHYHTFHHPMRSPAEVVEFYRSTGLRRFLDHLTPDQCDPLVAELTSRLETGYGTRGPLTFTFRRLFLWARRPAG
jgi:trans-aconitate 2-methyltransferase